MSVSMSMVFMKLERLKMHLQGQKMMLKDQLGYEQEMVEYLKNNLKNLKSISKCLKQAKISKIKRKMEMLRSKSETRRSVQSSSNQDPIPPKSQAKDSYEYYENVLCTLRKNRMKRKNSPHRRRDSFTSTKSKNRTTHNFLELTSDDEQLKTFTSPITPECERRIPMSPSSVVRSRKPPPTPPKYAQKPLDYYSKNGIFEPRTQDSYKSKLHSGKKRKRRKDIEEYTKKYGTQGTLEKSSSKKPRPPSVFTSSKKEKIYSEKRVYLKQYKKHHASPEISKPPVLLKTRHESFSKESSKEKGLFEFSDQVILEEDEDDEESFRVERTGFRDVVGESSSRTVKKLEFGDEKANAFIIASFCGDGGV